MPETELEKRVRTLEISDENTRVLLKTHVESCDKRGERSEWLLRIILGGVIAAVLAQILHIQIPH